MKNYGFFLLLYTLISFTSLAEITPVGQQANILVDNAYVRASIPGSTVSSAYMKITNNSEKAVTLVSASSNISPRVELHQHTMVKGMMRMRKLDAIIIKANEYIVLQPSGLHFMLFDVNKPLQSQQEVKLTLHFSDENIVTISTPVYSPRQEKSAQEKDGQPSTTHHHH